MRRSLLRIPSTMLASAVVLLTLTQCGSSDKAAVPTVPAAPPTTLLVTYGDQPTASAQMVCAPEAQAELAGSLRATPLKVTTPTWVDHVYSCTYQYPEGSFDLSVKELPTIPDTIAYFASLKAKYTVADPLALGQDGFTATDGTSVVRKDNKVLVVDVKHLSDQFGTPPHHRGDSSLIIATTILGCWTGE